MDATEHGGRHQRRRFVTRHDVEDAAGSGQPIRLQGRDVLTHEAAQRARDLGVAIERDKAVPSSAAAKVAAAPTADPARPATADPARPATADPARPASDADLRRAVRAAVVAELGSEPAGLEAAIDRAITKSRS